MGSGQGRLENGQNFAIGTNSLYVKDLKENMGNPTKNGFKFVSVPTSSHIKDKARKQLLTMSEEKSRKILEGTMKLDKTQGEFVGRAGLTYQQDVNKQHDSAKRSFARSYVNEMTKEAIFTDRKQNELNKIWPQIFYEMVFSALSDMSDTNSYMKKCLEDLDKS